MMLRCTVVYNAADFERCVKAGGSGRCEWCGDGVARAALAEDEEEEVQHSSGRDEAV